MYSQSSLATICASVLNREKKKVAIFNSEKQHESALCSTVDSLSRALEHKYVLYCYQAGEQDPSQQFT